MVLNAQPAVISEAPLDGFGRRHFGLPHFQQVVQRVDKHERRHDEASDNIRDLAEEVSG